MVVEGHMLFVHDSSAVLVLEFGACADEGVESTALLLDHRHGQQTVTLLGLILDNTVAVHGAHYVGVFAETQMEGFYVILMVLVAALPSFAWLYGDGWGAGGFQTLQGVGAEGFVTLVRPGDTRHLDATHHFKYYIGLLASPILAPSRLLSFHVLAVFPLRTVTHVVLVVDAIGTRLTPGNTVAPGVVVGTVFAVCGGVDDDDVGGTLAIPVPHLLLGDEVAVFADRRPDGAASEQPALGAILRTHLVIHQGPALGAALQSVDDRQDVQQVSLATLVLEVGGTTLLGLVLHIAA